MNESVQNLIDNTGKLAVNSKNPTNWCDIPLEMRAECIKKMDFKTKTRLKATSHTEKSLVEAKKHNFAQVRFVYTNQSNEENLKVIADGIQLESINNHEKTLNFVVKLLKNYEIGTFKLTDSDNRALEHFWPEIKKCAPFRFKTFESETTKSKLVQRFLENCHGLEAVLLGNSDHEASNLFDLMNLPVVINANVFQITSSSPYVLRRFVRKLLGARTEISLDYTSFWFFGLINHIASEFESRVVYKKDAEIRLRTDNESKHIVVRKNREWVMSFYSCTVIPSNILESEYEKCEWFKELIRYEGEEPVYEEDESEQASDEEYEEEPWYEQED